MKIVMNNNSIFRNKINRLGVIAVVIVTTAMATITPMMIATSTEAKNGRVVVTNSNNIENEKAVIQDKAAGKHCYWPKVVVDGHCGYWAFSSKTSDQSIAAGQENNKESGNDRVANQEPNNTCKLTHHCDDEDLKSHNTCRLTHHCED